jgi:uncharacterized protein (DUF1501 family)
MAKTFTRYALGPAVISNIVIWRSGRLEAVPTVRETARGHSHDHSSHTWNVVSVRAQRAVT